MPFFVNSTKLSSQTDTFSFIHSFFFFRFTEMIILSVQIKVADVMFHDYILIQASHLMEALVFGPKMNLCHLNVMIMVTKPLNVNANRIKFLIWSMEIGMHTIPFFNERRIIGKIQKSFFFRGGHFWRAKSKKCKKKFKKFYCPKLFVRSYQSFIYL